MKIHVVDGWHWRTGKPILQVFKDRGAAEMHMRRKQALELVAEIRLCTFTLRQAPTEGKVYVVDGARGRDDSMEAYDQGTWSEGTPILKVYTDKAKAMAALARLKAKDAAAVASVVACKIR